MPGGNRTGPRGEGPMTGRRAGYCAGYDVPGYMNPGPGGGYGGGYGMGRGRRGGFFGGGRGYRHWFHATGLPGWMRGRGAGWWHDAPAPPPVSREQRIEALQGEARMLEEELAGIRREIDSLAAGRETGEE